MDCMPLKDQQVLLPYFHLISHRLSSLKSLDFLFSCPICAAFRVLIEEEMIMSPACIFTLFVLNGPMFHFLSYAVLFFFQGRRCDSRLLKCLSRKKSNWHKVVQSTLHSLGPQCCHCHLFTGISVNKGSLPFAEQGNLVGKFGGQVLSLIPISVRFTFHGINTHSVFKFLD
ncbi:hypothetical protein CPB84DRAFT_1041561 [Gymnopilus junonius]|uniref:Uncharacterized protein n=1 Tax=Gymnopilus junonius TaxID=109634 RepID=A0A9P5NML0_GYMJU|nr:hypothetical protein CPB84DRAFT_1041561 [Gymnopilus junonius]